MVKSGRHMPQGRGWKIQKGTNKPFHATLLKVGQATDQSFRGARRRQAGSAGRGELRLEHDRELLRSQACKFEEEVFAVADEWRVQAEAKGWSVADG
jgi:hypothetical protein